MGDMMSEVKAEGLVSADCTGNPDELILLLQQIQARDGFISPQSLRQVALSLGISEARVYGVASFYAQFRFHRPGANHVRVCLGTACHVQGGHELSDEVQSRLHVRPRETTADGKFDFDEVACLGCCAQAAVVEVNGKIYNKMTREKVRRVLAEHDGA